MKTLYSVLFIALVITLFHSILESYIPLDGRFYFGEALACLFLLMFFAAVDFYGYDWRWPLSKRALNQIGTFD